jgi:ABC-2 type transport system ATP-binding protein
MDKAIVVDKLVKNFVVTEKEAGFVGALSSIFHPVKKTVEALKNITFTIQKGELVGFIGPNGAGKTTTMKVLSGLIHPDSGFVSVMGHDPWKKSGKYLKNISLIMGQKNQLWWDLPVIDSLEFNKAVYQIKDSDYEKNLSSLVEILKIGNLLKTPVRKLSLGQRMKVELVAALIHNPQVLFLDEPTVGLDLVAQQALRDFIFEYNRKNESTVLLTSHNMADLADLSRRVIVINEGNIVYDGLLEKLTKKYAPNKIIKVLFEKEVSLEDLQKIGNIDKYNYPEAVISVPRSTISYVASELLQNFDVIDIDIEEPPIEDVIRQVFETKDF